MFLSFLSKAKQMGKLMLRKPDARAIMRGNAQHLNLRGMVSFYQDSPGVLVVAEFMGLPEKTGKCGGNIFAFHIHEGDSCTGTPEESFSAVGSHYNPNNCAHPFHAGDLPPVFESGGQSFMAVWTGRFNVNDVIGRTVILHSHMDDFSTQPAGNSGEKIACGEIRRA